MPDSTPPPVDIELEAAGSENPVELRTIFLGGLLLLAVLAACYVAAEIVLPIVLAFVLGAMFQPVMRLLLRFRPAAHPRRAGHRGVAGQRLRRGRAAAVGALGRR